MPIVIALIVLVIVTVAVVTVVAPVIPPPTLQTPTPSIIVATTTISVQNASGELIRKQNSVQENSSSASSSPISVDSKKATSTSRVIPKKIDVPVVSATTSNPSSVIQVSPPPPVSVETILPVANVRARNAVVNVLCSAKNQTLASITGSGVIIDSRGIILTNAHLAQYFMLQDYPNQGSIACSIRTGSPAYPRYRAELLFVSPNWIRDHSADILLNEATGTGEHDYALLRITGTIDGSTLPDAFPSISPETNFYSVTKDAPVIIAGYPAGFLGSVAVERDLYLASAISTIQDLFTFSDANTKDLVSVGGTILAQKGASGGAVVGATGNLLGIVVTTTLASSTATRHLQAITLPYIDTALRDEAGMSIRDILSGDLEAKAESFRVTLLPVLRSLLVKAIEKN
jgi:hypothetical protein